jgi:flagellar hook protein FlgE
MPDIDFVTPRAASSPGAHTAGTPVIEITATGNARHTRGTDAPRGNATVVAAARIGGLDVEAADTAPLNRAGRERVTPATTAPAVSTTDHDVATNAAGAIVSPAALTDDRDRGSNRTDTARRAATTDHAPITTLPHRSDASRAATAHVTVVSAGASAPASAQATVLSADPSAASSAPVSDAPLAPYGATASDNAAATTETETAGLSGRSAHAVARPTGAPTTRVHVENHGPDPAEPRAVTPIAVDARADGAEPLRATAARSTSFAGSDAAGSGGSAGAGESGLGASARGTRDGHGASETAASATAGLTALDHLIGTGASHADRVSRSAEGGRSYDNGRTQTLGQILLATFTNPGGLTREGQSTYRETVNPGTPDVGAPGTSGRGNPARSRGRTSTSPTSSPSSSPRSAASRPTRG